MNIPHPYPDGAAEEWISVHQPKFEAGELINYAVTLKSTCELIGAVGLVINKRFHRAELGYWIDKILWGKGFALVAAAALVEYGFNHHGLHKIFAEHMTMNPASGAVMKKLGMQQEGYLIEHVLKSGKYMDIVFYGILKSEWNQRKHP